MIGPSNKTRAANHNSYVMKIMILLLAGFSLTANTYSELDRKPLGFCPICRSALDQIKKDHKRSKRSV